MTERSRGVLEQIERVDSQEEFILLECLATEILAATYENEQGG